MSRTPVPIPPLPRARRTALALGALLLCVPGSIGAQSAETRRAEETRVHTLRAEREFERERARYQAERARLMARIEALSRHVGSSAELNARDRRKLEAELGDAVRRLTAMNARLGVDVGQKLVQDASAAAARASVVQVLGETRASLASATRTGYLGITLSPTSNRVRVGSDGDLWVRYFEPPFIISVDPSSPAERAGLQRGDTVLAYDGRDVRDELPMHQVLEPGRAVRMTVRRDGRQRLVRLTVAPTPAIVRGRREEFLVPAPPRAVLSPARRPRAAASVPAPAAVARPGAAARSVAPAPPAAPPALRIAAGRGIAGAELARITPGLAAALGVRRGLLVTTVAPRSPAASAGLRDGDIILAANGRDVEDVAALSRAMSADGSARAATLEVQRAGKKRTVRLTW